MTLKEYFRKHFQDLEPICPDLMMITTVPKYVTYSLPALDAAAIRGLNRPNRSNGPTTTDDPASVQSPTILSRSETGQADAGESLSL